MAIDLKFLPACRAGVVLPAVKECFRLWQILIRPQVQMTEGWHPVAVGCLVLTHQEKWLVLIAPFFEPVNGQISYNVRAMSFDGGFSLGSQ